MNNQNCSCTLKMWFGTIGENGKSPRFKRIFSLRETYRSRLPRANRISRCGVMCYWHISIGKHILYHVSYTSNNICRDQYEKCWNKQQDRHQTIGTWHLPLTFHIHGEDALDAFYPTFHRKSCIKPERRKHKINQAFI